MIDSTPSNFSLERSMPVSLGALDQTMFCPKCGALLQQIGNELTCRTGKMVLSQAMERGLRRAFVDRTISPPERPFHFIVGGPWFCPGDGSLMSETEGVVRCTLCRISLNQFVHQLIELHPHTGR